MKQKVVKLLSRESRKLKKSEIEKIIEVPQNSDFGDYAFPCFPLVSIFKRNPEQIAQDLAKKLQKKLPREIEKIEVAGAYINFFVNKKILAKDVIKKAIDKNYGKGNYRARVMVEFSQANTHKAFHIGHIRGTSLGESLARILEFNGINVVRANYQGDAGMHVAKWLWCYQKYHKKQKLRKDESWIAEIYVDAVRRLTKDKTKGLQVEVDEINRKLEKAKNKKLMSLWKKTRKLSLDVFETIYRDLNTKFDVYFFERSMEKQGKQIAFELLKKGIAKKSEGAVVMDFEKQGLGVLVLLRKDGTVLYSAKDIALAEKKFKKYKIDSSIYVVGNEQNLYMKQLFKTLELMKLKQASNCKHITYGLVRLPTGKMSSRTGENILYSDFKKEIMDFAKKRIKQREPGLKKQELDKRALAVGISAIKYSMLKQDSKKSFIFIKKDALNFEGNSGPYLQYSYARASSILRKLKGIKLSKKLITEVNPYEFKLLKKISEFPEIINKAYTNLDPSLIANYSYQLAQIFNEFYHVCPVIKAENQQFRVDIVKAFKNVLGNCLNLLGIEVLERM